MAAQTAAQLALTHEHPLHPTVPLLRGISLPASGHRGGGSAAVAAGPRLQQQRRLLTPGGDQLHARWPVRSTERQLVEHRAGARMSHVCGWHGAGGIPAHLCGARAEKAGQGPLVLSG